MYNHKLKRAFRAAFIRTVPVLAGYIFIGITYGLYLNKSGLPLWYPLIMSSIIFSSSAELIAINLMGGSFDPLNTLVITLITGARYVFYGIAMLDRYKGMGAKKPYLIVALADETFSIICQSVVTPDVDRGWFMFFVTLLDHFYWFFSTNVGTLLGSLAKLNIRGMDFVMIALFVIIFMNQWMNEKRHVSEYIGGAASILCTVIFGRDNFIIPAMVLIIVILTLFRKPIEKAADENDNFRQKRLEDSGLGGIRHEWHRPLHHNVENQEKAAQETGVK